MVDDADELFRALGDDFFTRQSATATLYEMPVFGGFIRSVDIDMNLVHRADFRNRDAISLKTYGACLGTCHGRENPVLSLGQGIDKEVCGRAGANSDHHIVLDIIECRNRGLLFELVLSHGR